MSLERFQDLIRKEEQYDNLEIHMRGYAFDSLIYRYQMARYQAALLEEQQLIYQGKTKPEARDKVMNNYKRDCLRFIEILDEVIKEHD